MFLGFISQLLCTPKVAQEQNRKVMNPKYFSNYFKLFQSLQVFTCYSNFVTIQFEILFPYFNYLKIRALKNPYLPGFRPALREF